MGADDDGDCAGHVWVLTDLHPTSHGMQRAEECARCGTVQYDGGQAAVRDTRPPL